MDPAVIVAWVSKLAEGGVGWTLAAIFGALLYMRDKQAKGELLACQNARLELGERALVILEGNKTTLATLVATTESRSKTIEEVAAGLLMLVKQNESDTKTIATAIGHAVEITQAKIDAVAREVAR